MTFLAYIVFRRRRWCPVSHHGCRGRRAAMRNNSSNRRWVRTPYLRPIRIRRCSDRHCTTNSGNRTCSRRSPGSRRRRPGWAYLHSQRGRLGPCSHTRPPRARKGEQANQRYPVLRRMCNGSIPWVHARQGMKRFTALPCGRQ